MQLMLLSDHGRCAMGEFVTLSISDGISPEMDMLLKKTRNLKKAMKQVEQRVFNPLRRKAWARSGLQSQSGELKNSVEAWSGKKSAGVSVHSNAGSDLVIPKGLTHMRGARRHEFKKRNRATVKSHGRAGQSVRSHQRRNTGSPWGDVKKRQFIPQRLSGSDTQKIVKILMDHINV